MSSSQRKVALIMGVANQRSIAWSCVQKFLTSSSASDEAQKWDVIVTYQNERFAPKIQQLSSTIQPDNHLLGSCQCDVQTDLPALFSQQLPDLLQDRPIDTIIHSIAHAPNLSSHSLMNTSLQDYLEAHHISAYSFLETAQCSQALLSPSNNSSLVCLSYIGAIRAMPHYNVMGPAKASLEALVRGLALELGGDGSGTRVNAVSAGPLPTISAKGGITNFTQLKDAVGRQAPLGNVTADQVASTVQFLASDAASGITGQTIYVDGGYSITGGEV
jgi:enoyl-[acyl-carrier protein] reductase I